MARRRASQATIWGGLVWLAITAGACGSNPDAVQPTPPTALTTTTIVGNSPSDVVGWVTPTLYNGIAFVNGVPAGAPAAQLLRAAQSLSTACLASEGELKQTTWTGRAAVAESALASTLTGTVSLVAHPPSAGFAGALHTATSTMSQQVKALAAQVHS